MKIRLELWAVLLVLMVAATGACAPALAQQQKPNILAIMGDDIGYWNVSAYNRGQMGHRAPNIDRIANEGAIFTDYYLFMEQQAHGLEVWMQPFMTPRAPKLFNLRADPFERAEHEAGDYVRWFVEHAYVFVPAQAIVAQHLASFGEFPPRQRPGTFSVGQAMEMLTKKGSN